MPTPPERRARTNSPSSGVWMAPPAPLCDPPGGLLAEIVDEWFEFWSSPVAGGVTMASLPALKRLFRMRSQALQAHRDYEASPTVAGSQGQEVLNPQGRQALELEKKIIELEDRFGLNPRALLRLNVILADAVEAGERTAAALDRAEERQERADPRLADAQPAAADLGPAGRAVDGGAVRPR